MLSTLFVDLTGRGITAVLGVAIGCAGAWLLARWKRHQERRCILKGDARDTVVVEHHLVETVIGNHGERVPTVLRMRSVGQARLEEVVANGHLAAQLLHRASRVTARHTLISMEGAEGSYLLESLTNFVCARVAGGAFERDLYVMAPCCEPVGLLVHQPIVIVVIAVADLALFETWPACRDVQVEHGSDGARVLTLMELAQRFRAEQGKIAELRAAGQRTQYFETSYILDLALDKRAAVVPVRKVPWERFQNVLKQMNLET